MRRPVLSLLAVVFAVLCTAVAPAHTQTPEGYQECLRQAEKEFQSCLFFAEGLPSLRAECGDSYYAELLVCQQNREESEGGDSGDVSGGGGGSTTGGTTGTTGTPPGTTTPPKKPKPKKDPKDSCAGGRATAAAAARGKWAKDTYKWAKATDLGRREGSWAESASAGSEPSTFATKYVAPTSRAQQAHDLAYWKASKAEQQAAWNARYQRSWSTLGGAAGRAGRMLGAVGAAWPVIVVGTNLYYDVRDPTITGQEVGWNAVENTFDVLNPFYVPPMTPEEVEQSILECKGGAPAQ